MVIAPVSKTRIFENSAEEFIVRTLGMEILELYHSYTDSDTGIFQRLRNLCDLINVSEKQFFEDFGKAVILCFVRDYHAYFSKYHTLTNFLDAVQSVMHEEVKRVHKDSNPPEISIRSIDKKEHILIYRSERNLPNLVKGMLSGLSNVYMTEIEIHSVNYMKEDDSYHIRFTII
jgi:hypothetical protein